MLLLLSLACSDKDPSDSGGPDNDGDFYTSSDCDDADPAVNPGADEVCNGIDDDCDGETDESPVDGGTWYVDGDGDGVGGNQAVTVCDQPSGTSTETGDCDDEDASVQTESTFYADADLDGYGDDESVEDACGAPSDEHVEQGGDCDDDDATRYPGATEVCGDGVVQDCDLSAEEALATCSTWETDLSAEVSLEGFAFAFATGDVDGDGVDDLVLSTESGPRSGLFHAAYLHYGPLTSADVEDGVALSHEDDSSNFGVSMALRNGEVAVGDSQDGTLYIWSGPTTATGLSDAHAISGSTGFGNHLIVHAEGYAVSNLVEDDSTGKVWLVDSSATTSEDAGATISGPGAGALFGHRLVSGDTDGDGVDDLVVGAFEVGTAYVFAGPVTGALSSEDGLALSGDSAFGASIALGDDDGDGYADLYVGAPNESDTETRSGAIYLFAGPATADTDTSAAAGRLVGPDVTNARFGGRLAVDDLDRDGHADLLHGAGFGYKSAYAEYGAGGHGWTGINYGPLTSAEAHSIELSGELDAGADLNGDGWSDVVVAGTDLFFFPGY